MVSGERSAAAEPLAARLRNQGYLRLSRTLWSIAIDTLCPQARLVLNSADHQWLVHAVSDSVAQSTDAALQVLLAGLSQLLEEAPPDLVAKLEDLRRQAEHGWE